MFVEPAPTPYDLCFHLFGIPVRISPWFWLMTALLGWNALDDGFVFLAIWVWCVLVSILVHELGHVFMGQLFGTDGHIVLYGLGGLAIDSNNLPNRWKRIAVSFAGPLAGFALFGLVWLGLYLAAGRELLPPIKAAVGDLLRINLFWGILNLAPIFPLDGGQISRDFLGWLTPRRGAYFAYGISFVCAALLAVNALLAANGRHLIPLAPGGLYAALLFGSLAWSSFQALQHEQESINRWIFPDDDR